MSEFKPLLLSLSSQLSPSLVVEVLPSGFTTHSILLNDGRTHDILPGPYEPPGHAHPAHQFQNTIVGRYANRVPKSQNGGYHIEKNGVNALVNPIPNETPEVSLHGGPKALDQALFKQIEPSASSLFSPIEIKALTSDYALYTTTSPAGHNGYPGTLLLEALICLIDPTKPTREEINWGQLLVVYRAKIQEPAIVTPINLTQHWGFNLEMSLSRAPEEVITIKNHNLIIRADHILELDSSALATGNLIPTEGTSHDHNNKRIGDAFPESGYDHFYVFKSEIRQAHTKTQPTTVPLSSLKTLDLLSELLSATVAAPPQVELSSPKSGFKLSFSTNQSGVQFYTANGQSGAGTKKKIHGGSKEENGNGYPIHAAAYLEFHEPLASFLHPHNNIDTLITSDELYHHFVKINFTSTITPR